ncbi:MAG: MFS transporter [Candidatus Peregrinibacteria bacterium]|nr:MFS transporter [Candidatus Peregrinibacteria bacterium]
MLESLREISLLNRFFNIRGNEWSRVIFALVIKFLYRTSFVVGWTVLVAMFVSRYGILSLPYLFVINAVFSIIGSVVYSLFFERMTRVAVMLSTIVLSGLFLFVAAVVVNTHAILFFSLLILSISILLNQLRIIMIAYVEELFDPLTSERTFPVIEVSETLGGIVAGLLVTLLSSYFSLSSFIYLMVSVLFLLIPLLLFFDFDEDKVELVHKKNHEKGPDGIFSQLKQAFDSKSHSSFVFGLIFIVLFQWVIFNLIEFQYTKVVYQNVSHVIFEAGSGFEHAFIHNLGLLFVLFSASALIVEIFLGSRLITSLGVVGAMLLHPLVTLLSLAGLFFRFDFLTAVLAKNNFTLTSVIHTNTYHISYYAVKEKVREHLREFLEGVVRPLGALLGTLFVIVLDKIFEGSSLNLALNIAMVVCTLIFFYITYRQQEKYTKVVTEELLNSNEKHIRFNAIDLLAQRGHKLALSTLKTLLAKSDELASIKVKILAVMSELQSPDTVLDIISCLSSEKAEIREAALDTLISFKFLNSYSKEYLFIKYELIESLKGLYKEEKDKQILAKIIYLMSLLSNVSTVEFLFKVLHSKNSDHKSDAIFALGKCDDDKIAKILEEYLYSKNLSYQLNAAMALVNFKKYRDEALHVINSFIYSDKKDRIMYGLLAIGELNMKSKKSVCLKYLDSDDIDLRMYSAISLAKMGFYHSVSSILDLLFNGDEHMVKKIKSSIKNVDVRIYKNIDKIMKHVVSQKVEELKVKNNHSNLESFSNDSLSHLKKLYTLIDEYEEVETINSLVKNNL